MAPAAAGGATIVEKNVLVTLAPDGSLHERTRLRVRLESTADVNAWSVYPIYLDENRSLGAVRAFAVLPGGEQVKVRRRDRDTMEYSGGVTHSSARFHLLDFARPAVGAELEVEYEVEVRPYFPADQIVLIGDDDVERLEVEVRGGGDAWRWRLDGPADGLEIEELPGGVRIRAAGLPGVEVPDYGPGGAAVYPVLRYAWGPEGGWRQVGAWYTELLAAVPRQAVPVRALARELTAGLETPRERLETLLAFLRRKVRYVAVEVGIGGYRPSPPEEVLGRKWGDCKDKSLLLIDLLHEVGIPAYPVLILADDDRRLDVEFPSPGQFNHVIAAVPSAAVDFGVDDPVGDGYFFVDPTQELGTGGWLHPADQDQDVLVVRDGTGALARTPVRPGLERRKLQVTLRVTPEGAAAGGAGLQIHGGRATGFLAQIAGEAPERTEEDARRIFAALLPGVEVGRVGWAEAEGAVPGVDLSAAVRVERLVEGLGSRPSLRLAGLGSLPEPRALEERDVPMVLRPQATEMTWSLYLPEGACLPTPQEERVENEVGLFVQTVTAADGKATVERRIEIRRRWIEPDLFPALRELALAEHRASRRRIRLECAAGGGNAGGR
jgi:transglutaminase-like putative cysteine protease